MRNRRTDTRALRLACVGRAVLLLFAAACAGNAFADAYLPAIGGGGGGQFKSRCATGQVLAGVELRVGDDVDAIRPLCVTTTGPRRVGPVPYTVGTGLVRHYRDANREVNGQYSELFGDWTGLAPGWAGGPGGALTNLVCPADHPVVTGLYIGAEGVDTVIVNNVHLFCGEVSTTPDSGTYPAAVMDAPGYRASEPPLGFGVGGAPARNSQDTELCPAGTVAVGIHGRSGKWLDAAGLVCDAPPPPPTPGVRTIGRVEPSSAPAPARSICESARDARARNSPAAAALESRCKEESAPVVHSIGRIGGPRVSAPQGSICDAARAARARHSPAAATLEARCAAQPPAPAAAPPADAPVDPPGDAPPADVPPEEPAPVDPVPVDPADPADAGG